MLIGGCDDKRCDKTIAPCSWEDAKCAGRASWCGHRCPYSNSNPLFICMITIFRNYFGDHSIQRNNMTTDWL